MNRNQDLSRETTGKSGGLQHNRSDLRRKLKAKIQNSRNARSGHSTKEQIFRTNMANIPNPGTGNGPVGSEISDALANLMSLSNSQNKGKIKKAKKNLNNVVKDQLVNNIVASEAKKDPINEIPVTTVDKVLLDGFVDDESVSSDLD